MSKVTIELQPQQIKEAFEQLNIEEKIKLVEEFEKETRRARWGNLISRIRQRVKNNPIPQKDINRAITQVRKQIYASIKNYN